MALLIGVTMGNAFGVLPAGAAKSDDANRLAASGAVVLTNALIDGASRCARRYHAALASNVLPRVQAVQAKANRMRQPRAEMPGHWLFWDGHGILARTARQERLLAALRSRIVNNHRCVRPILARGGRIRCLKWIPVSADDQPPAQTALRTAPRKHDISPAERRLAAAISTLVSGKGAFQELAHGTALYHIVQRTTDELIAYARQPYRSTICTGASGVLGFYQRQLTPLSRKAQQAAEIRRATQAAAMDTGQAALAHGEQTQTSGSPDFVRLIRKLVEPLLPPQERAALISSGDAFGTLTIAREHLTEQRLEALAAHRGNPLRKALRNIEIALYAAHNAKHVIKLNESFTHIFKITSDAHDRHCTCAPTKERK